MKKYDVAVVGATGMVGRMFLRVLEEKQFPINNFYAFASAKSAGSKVTMNGKEYEVEELKESSFDRHIDIALFSAGGETSKKYSPIAASKGVVVIDNSSAFRMDKDVPLVVPEVNPLAVNKHKGIIANPNCSTIQAVVALKPLHDKYGIKRIVYSTYQAVSGTGIKGVTDLEEGIKGNPPKAYPHPIAYNCLPHIDVFNEDGTKLGVLNEVMTTGANDVYVIKTADNKEILIPAIKDCILNVNIDKKEITVHLLDGLI
jgi:aspartate-semialdehyde dehydrogenase